MIALVIVTITVGAGALPQSGWILGQDRKEFKTEADGGGSDAAEAADSVGKHVNHALR